MVDAEYIRHSEKPEWGVGVLVSERHDQRTYLFEDGVTRTFKTALVSKFLEAAPPPSDEDRVRLARGKSAGGTATPIAVNLELEAEIRKNPEDPGPYIVYADWLQQRKDPRGQLIAIQEQLSHDPDNKKLRAAETALLSAHGDYLVPEQLHAALRSQARSPDALARCSLHWHLGFIERARLAKSARQQIDLVAIGQQLLGHPSASFLRELVLGPLGTPDGFDYGPLIAAIARHQLPLLESLVIGDFTMEHMELRYTRAGNLAGLLAAAPNLVALSIRAGDVAFAAIPVLARLRTLRIFSNLEARERDVIFAARMPELETLELGGDRVKVRASDIATLAANTSLAHLRELVVRRSEGTQTILNALIKSPLLERLDRLVLSDGDLGEKAVEKLAKHASKFSHLSALDLSGNPLSPAHALQLTRLVRAVATPRPRAAIDEASVLRRTNDPRNAAAARELADPARWLELGRDLGRLWGEYEGKDHYHVFANIDDRRCGCSCGSPRSPCKHALALLLMLARGHAFPERPVPDAVIRNASVERPRYWPVWE